VSTETTAQKLVELCKAGKNFDAMHQLYSDTIVSVEAVPGATGSRETLGKKAVIEKSAKWASQYEILSGSIDGPYLSGDRFAVTFQFVVTSKTTGVTSTLNEIAIYTVENDLITKEEFFYGENTATLLSR